MTDETEATTARYEAVLRQIGSPAHVPKGFDPLDWWRYRACKQGEIAREALGVTAEDLIRATWENATPNPENEDPATTAGSTVSDTSSRA